MAKLNTRWLREVSITKEFDIALSDSQVSSFQIPSNSVIHSIHLIIDTPYSTGSAIQIGRTGAPNLLMDVDDNDAAGADVGDIYECDQNTEWGATRLPVLVTVTGPPISGAGAVVVIYSTLKDD